MTYAQREEIFSKECLTIKDMQALLGLSYDDAAQIIRNIRRRTDRLGIQGKIHIQDYLDYFDIQSERYAKLPDEDLKVLVPLVKDRKAV